jgi:hypothetical protein
MRALHPLASALVIAAVSNMTTFPAAAQYTEVQASKKVIGDVEFDWGRDGIFCAACNYGIGNAQFNWTNRLHDLWVGTVNAQTGEFNTPKTEQMTKVDTNAFFWETWGNGPEWGFSTPPGAPGGNPISQLVYTRFANGDPASPPYSGAAYATLTPSGWQVGFLPGAIGAYDGTGVSNMVLPEASQCTTSTVSMVLFRNIATPQQMFTEPLSTAVGTAPQQTPFGAYANGIGERWVPCTTALTFQGNAIYTSGSGVQTELQQVYWYDTVSGVVQQLTTDPTGKQRATMFIAPDFNHTTILMAAADTSASGAIQVYEQTGTAANGSPQLTLVNTIVSPEAAEPFIFDPKAFIHCNPTCETYVVYGVTSVPGSQKGLTVPNGLAVAKLNPATPMNNLLVSGITSPYQRLDPKYFITQQYGPFVYFARIVPASPGTTYTALGYWYINMQLGAPSGPCVGASAEGGLLTGC